MKSTTKRYAILFAAMALTSALGHAAPSSQEGAGEYVDDTVITTKVKAAIFGDAALKSAEINVETFKGVVQLSGFVSSSDAEHKATELARSIKGVKSVKDDMRVK